jgi:hypothetical protein
VREGTRVVEDADTLEIATDRVKLTMRVAETGEWQMRRLEA